MTLTVDPQSIVLELLGGGHWGVRPPLLEAHGDALACARAQGLDLPTIG